MKLHIKTQREHDPILHRMAHEMGVAGVRDVVDIAIFNLIGVWMTQHGYQTLEDALAPPLSVPVLAVAAAAKRAAAGN